MKPELKELKDTIFVFNSFNSYDDFSLEKSSGGKIIEARRLAWLARLAIRRRRNLRKNLGKKGFSPALLEEGKPKIPPPLQLVSENYGKAQAIIDFIIGGFHAERKNDRA